MDSLNFNSEETLPNLSARVAFQVNSSAVFKEDVDIVPVIVDDTLSYISSPPKKTKMTRKKFASHHFSPRHITEKALTTMS